MSDYEANEGYIRKRYRHLEGEALAEYISHAPAMPLGHDEVDVGTTPVGLPDIPENCRRVILVAPTVGFTYTDDGSAPSASHGIPIPAGVVFVYDTDPDENFQMWAATTVSVRVAYYG